jgi:quinol monooxygenase YgiN
VKRQELLLRYEQHRDNAEDLLLYADEPYRHHDGAAADAARANAHATLALVYLTDLLADDG